MDETHSQTNRFTGLSGVLVSMILGAFMLAIMIQTIQAQDTDLTAAEISGSQKIVGAEKAAPGTALHYSVIIKNGSASPVFDLSMKDELPPELTLMTNTISVSGDGIGEYGASVGVITWTGTIAGSSEVNISFQATLTDTVVQGVVITNTAIITAQESVISRSAATTVVTGSGNLHIPLIFFEPPPPKPVLMQITKPSSQNKWTLGWTVSDETYVSSYVFQEARQADFQGATEINLPKTTTSIERSHAPSLDNEFYYRVKAVGPYGVSPWSDVVLIVGAYRDDFSDPSSGWDLRRTTYIEKTVFWYSSSGYLVNIVDDRWDWMIMSPLVKAPAPPYYIEYRARVNDASNLVTGGLVVGGDWNGQPCPDKTDFNTLYKGTNCFNQFYNFNYIFYGPLKLLFERVDALVWCLNCGGSPMKRLGDIGQSWPPFTVFNNGPAENWHTYRIEVRENGLTLYIDGNYVKFFGDQRYVNRPYFGLFASTDEYKPSIWLYDYFQVGFLD